MTAFTKKSAHSQNHAASVNEKGNDAFFGVQAKLSIGKSNDKYEAEADKAADQIVSKTTKNNPEPFFSPSPIVQNKSDEVQKKEETAPQKSIAENLSPVVQLKSEKEEKETVVPEKATVEETPQHKTEVPQNETAKTTETISVPKPIVQQKKAEEEVQTKEEEEIQSKEDEKELQMSAGTDASPSDDSNLENNLNRSKGSGSPLSGNTRTEMESGFGADFGKVKVHNDSNAVQMNKELGSQAFANGNDIYFNEGKYNTNSTAGKHLLAHELTHTLQQGASAVQPKMIQKTPTAATPVTTASASSERISLQTPTFTPPEAIATQIEAAGNRGAEVNVTFGQWASGVIKMKKNTDGTYNTKDNRQSINLNISYLSPLTSINITPVLAIQIENNNINGYITVKTGDRLVGNPAGLINAIKDNSETFGWIGIDVTSVPNVQNSIEGGNLTLTANGIPVQLGGFVNATLDFGIQGEAITFRASGSIEVPNLSPTQITIERNAEGNITGEIDLAVNMANFNGSIHAAFLNGTFDIRGTVGYQTEKISGQVTLLVTDTATARNAALSQLDPTQIDESARETNGIPEANSGPTPGPRAMAGWGEVDFSFTEWMTGRAMVIIDNEGHVTIHGEITPPAEVELFAQRDYIREIFTVEVRTMYGVPLVGNVFLFANIGLEALAKIGPAKIYNIRAVGTYSTDPAVFNDFSLSASFNMSMFAGLRLRAEGGLGVELLGHDIKVGVGVNALAGIRGYVDATPTIGYRETASPEAGRQGEFYIHGHAEMAAQPFLALGGDLFVELDSPWWSPAPDDKWTWPLGELEYPLPGEFGIGADVDYVLGSDELPEVEFAPVDFNSDKFMTDLMNDHVPPAQSTDAEHPAEFQEGATGGEGSATPQVTDSTGNPNAGTTGTPPGADAPPNPPTPEVLAHWGDGLQALRALATTSENHPLTQAQVTAELNPIRTRHHFTHLTARRNGENWNIDAEMPNINNHNTPILVKGVRGVGEEENGEVNGETNAVKGEILQIERPFDETDGDRHTLRFRDNHNAIQLMVHSDPKDIFEYLHSDEVDQNDSTVRDAIRLATEIRTMANNAANTSGVIPNLNSKMRELSEMMSHIRGNLRRYLPANPVYNYQPQGNKAHKAEVTLLSANRSGGTEPGGSFVQGWEAIQTGGLTRGAGHWKRLHLINQGFGGFGVPENLTPGTTSNNSSYDNRFDDPVKNLIGSRPNDPTKQGVVKIVAEVDSYYSGPFPANVSAPLGGPLDVKDPTNRVTRDNYAQHIKFEAWEYNYVNRSWELGNKFVDAGLDIDLPDWNSVNPPVIGVGTRSEIVRAYNSLQPRDKYRVDSQLSSSFESILTDTVMDIIRSRTYSNVTDFRNAITAEVSAPSTPSGRRTPETITRLNEVKNIIPIMVNANVLKF
ncbi:eCIS core domain-containing protein [Flavobacterium tructae]|uniref:eCIS core domain-containing protein n=1 Tax=Flavobacterium tructae TaxID=1114873 RepID=A0A1S1J1L5_9FLAO|nr:DUF4157 domain-containing protein [Flavobacterium tructae]OHT43385.1 hypothetical protein BHE19_19035 [Flavobacterium tructae]